MLVQIDLYKSTGKWHLGGRVEVEKLPHQDGVLGEILEKQDIAVKGWEVHGSYFLVVSDIPESKNDPNYRMTYSRLYTPEQIQKCAITTYLNLL